MKSTLSNVLGGGHVAGGDDLLFFIEDRRGLVEAVLQLGSTFVPTLGDCDRSALRGESRFPQSLAHLKFVRAKDAAAPDLISTPSIGMTQMKNQREPLTMARNRARSNSARRFEITSEGPSLGERMLAATIAPCLFAISLVLALTPLKLLGVAAFSFATFLPSSVFIGLGFAASAYGAWKGMDGLTDLLGHAFLTHPSDQKDVGKTGAFWIAILATAFLLSRL